MHNLQQKRCRIVQGMPLGRILLQRVDGELNTDKYVQLPSKHGFNHGGTIFSERMGANIWDLDHQLILQFDGEFCYKDDLPFNLCIKYLDEGLSRQIWRGNVVVCSAPRDDDEDEAGNLFSWLDVTMADLRFLVQWLQYYLGLMQVGYSEEVLHSLTHKKWTLENDGPNSQS